MNEQKARKLIDIKTETYLIDLQRGRVTVQALSNNIQAKFNEFPMSDIGAMAAAMSIYMNVTVGELV